MRPIILAAAALLSSVAASAQLGPVVVTPAATDMRLGKLRLTALRDAAANAPNDAKVFGVETGPEAVEAVLAAAGAAPGQISLSVNTLLVRMPGHVVLVDTGYGAPHGIMLDSLARAGVAPAAVTDILISHGHGDHVGGLIDADGKPVYPRATVRMAADEWTAIQAAPANAKLVAGIAPRVKTFVAGAAVLPGVASVDLSGHTPGHSGYRISSGGQSVLAIGDMAHSYVVSLGKPDWAMGYDRDRKQGAERRRSVLAAEARDEELIFSPHFPYPGFGRVVVAGDGFAWQPQPGLTAK
ncbi:MBL fold metallo-hydrolase [Sandarakinorhabdus sp. DWP1-3-1]|uniref:MBL fold metallo-hydrolase n=1 Tax=Sandarakinorhabdus sp. DWP1-3-1 TaxID=2804627 RepID=UPI003CECD2E5